MDEYVYVGKIINTFGIKGEMKIQSDFEFKDRVFKKDIIVFIGRDKNKETISSHRVHKNYDLLCFKGYTNINEILSYKGQNLYVKRSSLQLQDNEYLLNDLIGFEVFDENISLGIVLDIQKEINNVVLKVKGSKTFYLPLIPYYINKVIVKEKKILTNNGRGLII